MCDRKSAFSREEAKAASRRTHMRAYACPYCHRWHLTKIERHDRKRR